MEGRIRRARVEDADALGALHARGLSHFYLRSVPAEALAQADEARLVEHWSQAIASPPTPDWRVWVIDFGDELRGFTHTGPSGDRQLEVTTTGEIHALHVHPDHGKSGLGRSLLTWCVDDLSDRGYLTAIAWCPHKAQGARHFLEAGGFLIDGPPAERELHGAACAQLRYRKRLRQDPTL